MGFEFLTLPPDLKLPFHDDAWVETAGKPKPLTEGAWRMCDAPDNLFPVWPAAGLE